MSMKIIFMSCVMIMNKLLSLPRSRKYDRQFISMMNVSMHEDQNLITVKHIFHRSFPPVHSHSYSFLTDFTYLNLYWIKGALLCLF